MPRILVLGYSEASMLLASRNCPTIGALLAIHGQREHAVEADVPHKLTLKFDDAPIVPEHDPLEQSRMRIRAAEAADIGLHLQPPTRDHVARIISFAGEIADIDGVCLCHCRAGISRSTAAALLCLAAWSSPGDEAACVDHLRRIRPAAQPHRDLVRIGDALLGRRGALVAALT